MSSHGGLRVKFEHSSLRANGLVGTKQKWESHWLNAVSPVEFDWLVDVARCMWLMAVMEEDVVAVLSWIRYFYSTPRRLVHARTRLLQRNPFRG